MSGPVVLLLRVLLALALYVFLGLALWMLWQDLRQTARGVSIRSVPAIRLETRNRKRAARYRAFVQPEVILGRDPGCDVLLSDPSVSARHALLSFHHGQWWLDDLGSSNGTRLNHEIVRTSTVLTSGDEIQCGHSRVLISLTGEGLPLVQAGEDGQNG
jgi:pSer/pThr/pTyr-binding forkhead associated (FHA) protein